LTPPDFHFIVMESAQLMSDWENTPHRDATFIERLLGSKFGTLLTSATVLLCIAIAIWMQTQKPSAVAEPDPEEIIRMIKGGNVPSSQSQ